MSKHQVPGRPRQIHFSNNRNLTVVEVKTLQDRRAFLELPLKIYKNDPNFIRPFDHDIENIFKPEKNKRFKSGGEAIRWILKNDAGKVIGRIAAFVDKKSIDSSDFPLGGCGFFECVNEQEAANMLFDTCKNWLEKRGMEGMDGPINFGERDRWWGLLVDGFTPPSYCVPYNPPYYRQLFENYGFGLYYEQFTFYRKVMEPIQQKFLKKTEALLQDSDYHFTHIYKNNLSKYAEDFRTVYNKTWGAKHKGFKEMTQQTAMNIMNAIKPIMDEKIIVFGYYKGEAMAVFVNLPDINPIVKKLHGRLGWWEKLKFAYYLKKRISRTMFGVIFGVAPEHQGKGAEGALITTCANIIQSKDHQHYDAIEMTWIGDFNPRMIAVAKGLGASPNKIHATFRFLFDPNRPFEKHPVLD